MLLAAALVPVITPKQRLVSEAPAIILEKSIPVAFGDWSIDKTIVPVQVSPEVQAQLDKIYSQTLARTYVNSLGQRIMLSIAYGGTQKDDLQLHRPEGCYRGQGFDVAKVVESSLQVGSHTIPLRRLVASKPGRVEPITYWMMIGDQFAFGRTGYKIAQLKYTLTGVIPDGVLFRVSSMGSRQEEAYALHQKFIQEMLLAMSPQDRKRLSGF